MMKTNKSVIFALIILVSGCSNSSHKTDQPRERAKVFLGNFITMEASQKSAKAVAVQGEQIIGVGGLADLRTQLKNVDLDIIRTYKDKTILPGFIDNHLHPTLAGILLPTTFITPFDWSLPGREFKGVQGRDNYIDRLKELVATHNDAAKPFITWGYHQLFHGELSRADLDKISSTQAILVWQRSFHELILNSPALTALGITEQEYGSHPSIDLEKGHFWELGLFSIFPKLAPIILAPTRMQSGMRDALVHAQQNGVTTVADQGFPLLNFDMELGHLSAVVSDLNVPTRVYIVGNGKTLAPEGFDKGLATLAALPQHNTEQITFLPKQVKLLADGAFYSQLMQMEDGYLDGHHGEWIMPPEELAEAARIYWSDGYQLHIHVNGDKGVNVVLKIIEDLNKEMPREHKTVLHHYGYSSENHAERIAALGISVSANPFYLWALGDKYAEVGLGPERAHNITRLGDLERNGVPISFHSDLPMAPAAPLKLASIAASRISASGKLLNGEERVSVNTALRAITIDAAKAIQQEDSIGSIKVGKIADFTILNQDPFDVSPEQLDEIKVSGTIVGGTFYPQSD